MARKRYSDEDCLRVLREIEVHLAGGMDVPTACRTAGISDATYYTRRKKFGGMARSDLAEKKALEKENKELRRANEILKTASAFFAQAEIDRRPK